MEKIKGRRKTGNLSDSKTEKDIKDLKKELKANGLSKFFIKTYGCQQNVSDSEKIKGIMEKAGCEAVEDEQIADIVIFNTCAVRHTAEDRVFGHIGAAKEYFTKNREKLLLIGGCMVHQPHIIEIIKKKYPYVDLLFSTNDLGNLPSLLLHRLNQNKNVYGSHTMAQHIDETLPVKRDMSYRALVPIMYGCDNFCSYCSVPFVRGRERSRKSEDIVKEFEEAVDSGYREIMLLGQNVNSYGSNLEQNINFSKLLKILSDIEGDFRIRFMTSHPKDVSDELFDAIANSSKISRSIHLPVQSGSDRILKLMNRGYTRKDYLKLVDSARKRIENVSFTSDIIVGFPGETGEDYAETVSLVEEVGFYSLFIFIYSVREGTKAALLQDSLAHSEKSKRLIDLTKVQDAISERYDRDLLNTVQKGIAMRPMDDGSTEVRLDINSTVVSKGTVKTGEFCSVIPTELINRRLYGRII